MNYRILDSKVYGCLEDEPPHEYIYESLTQLDSKLSSDDIWFCKGNYQLNFWLDTDNKNTIYCNAFVLTNPDDENDSSTEPCRYDYEIERIV